MTIPGFQLACRRSAKIILFILPEATPVESPRYMQLKTFEKLC